MLLDADTETLDTYGVDIEGVRGIDDEMFDELSFPLVALEQEYRQELEPVAQVYDEAVVWLNRAYDLDDTNRRRMAYSFVCSLLDSARSFLADLITSSGGRAPDRCMEQLYPADLARSH